MLNLSTKWRPLTLSCAKPFDNFAKRSCSGRAKNESIFGVSAVALFDRPVDATTRCPSCESSATATLPTPPAAPVTSTSPASGLSPCRSRAITASIAVNPAVPIAIARRALSRSGRRTRYDALTRAFSA